MILPLLSTHISLPRRTPAAVPNANAIRPRATIFSVLIFRNASALVVAPTAVSYTHLDVYKRQTTGTAVPPIC